MIHHVMACSIMADAIYCDGSNTALHIAHDGTCVEQDESQCSKSIVMATPLLTHCEQHLQQLFCHLLLKPNSFYPHNSTGNVQ